MAAGLVFGVGAVVTLAAWNDSVWSRGNFGLGDQQWNMQGSVDAGTTWLEYQTEPTAGVMTFTVDPENMTPGVPVAALFGLKEEFGNLASTGTLNQGDVTLGPDLAAALSVNAYDLGQAATAPTGCDPALAAGTTLISGNIPSTGNSGPIAMPADETIAQWVCFVVELDDVPPAGLDPATSVAWEFSFVTA